MFKLTYKQYGTQLVSYFNDIKDIGQALINIVNDEKEENAAMKWCGNAHIGDSIVRQKYKYKIECFSEEALRKYIENSVLKPIKDRIYDISFEFIGWDNDAMTWDIDLKTNIKDVSYIKFHDNYGYYLCINVDEDGEGYKELASVTDKNKAKFIERATNVIVKAKSIIKEPESKNFTKTKDVVNMIKKANELKSEWHGRIYNDGCWWVDIERHPYGQIRFWVGFEDKRNGNSRASIVTLAYLNKQGELRYCTDGIQIKPVVWKKIQSVAKALIKEGILEI